MFHRGHVHQITPWKGDVRGDPGALGAHRFLFHLDQDFTAILKDAFDGPAAAGAPPTPPRRALFLARRESRILFPLKARQIPGHVGGMQEGGSIQAYLHEGSLHPGHDPDHLALVDIPDDPALAGALDGELGDHAVFQAGDPGLAEGYVNDKFIRHINPFRPESSKS